VACYATVLRYDTVGVAAHVQSNCLTIDGSRGSSDIAATSAHVGSMHPMVLVAAGPHSMGTTPSITMRDSTNNSNKEGAIKQSLPLTRKLQPSLQLAASQVQAQGSP
jgi:hypothetical protein